MPTMAELGAAWEQIGYWRLKEGLTASTAALRLGIVPPRDPKDWHYIAGEIVSLHRDLRAQLQAMRDGTWTEAA